MYKSIRASALVRCKQSLLLMKCQAQRSCTTQASSDILQENKSSARPFKDIPRPSGIYSLPFIGIILLFKPFGNYEVKRVDKLFLDLFKKHGPLNKIRLGSEWLVLVSDPHDIEKVVRNEGKFPVRGPIPLLEAYVKKKKVTPSLAILNGQKWADMRRPAQLSMRKPRNVAKFAPKLSEVADDFVEKYRTSCRMDLPYQCMEYSTEGVGMLCFNTRLGCIDKSGTGQKTQLMDNIRTFFLMFGQQFYVFPWYRWFEDKYYKAFAGSMDYISTIGEEHLNKALERLQNRKEIPEDEADLLTEMLLTPGMTLDMVNRNVIDLFVAGIESTAQTMTFLLYHLAKNPDVQEKLFKELEPLMAPKGIIDNDVLQKIRYLRGCLKESFRLIYPLPGGTQRILDNDICLRGYRIPKKTKLLLLNLIVGKDEKYFPEPEKFKPERWLRDERTDPVHAFAQIPFGFGTRNCIGQRFAEMEVFIVTAKIVRNYKLKLPKGLAEVEYEYQTFATPVKPFSIILEPR